MNTTSRSHRHIVAIVALLAMAALNLVSAGPAGAAPLQGGTTYSNAVDLPVEIPGSFVGSNANATGANGSDDSYWNNTTWWSFTPGDDMNLTIRASSVSPRWDNTLEVRTSSGALIGQNDDAYGLDAMLTVSLEGGTSYRLGLGAYRESGRGSATISLSDRGPDAPTDVTVTPGIDSADVSWTAPDENFAPITMYEVRCTPEGGSESTCGTVGGTPPSTTTTVTGLPAGVTHSFRVVAYNGNGPSELSTAVEATPMGLVVTAVPDPSTYGDSVTLTVTVLPTPSADEGTVTFTIDGQPVGEPVPVAGGTAQLVVTDLQAGTGTVEADFSGGGGVAAMSASTSLAVTKADQTIEVGTLPRQWFVGASHGVSATATSALPVTVTPHGACELEAGSLAFRSAGTCTIELSQDGDHNWNAAPTVTVEIDVVKIDPVDVQLPVTPPAPAPVPQLPTLPIPPAAALNDDATGSVHRIYLALFRRVADQGGLAHWVGRHDAGMPMTVIVQQFALSPEWQTAYGNPRGADLVEVLYRIVLGREADAAGRAHWIEQLRSGRLTEAQLIARFANSGEMIERLREALAVR